MKNYKILKEGNDMNAASFAERQIKSTAIGEDIRDRTLAFAKDFKASWVGLGQSLYAIWDGKFYHGWGYEKFEHYTHKELGLNKNVALKLLKTYLFLETDEPAYLQQGFAEGRETVNVPGVEAVNVLRLAKQKKELERGDYAKLKKSVFDKGKDASVVRKELTAIIKERKPVDPKEERDQRNRASILNLINSIKSFKKDMEVLKLVSPELVEDAHGLMEKLETEMP